MLLFVRNARISKLQMTHHGYFEPRGQSRLVTFPKERVNERPNQPKWLLLRKRSVIEFFNNG